MAIIPLRTVIVNKKTVTIRFLWPVGTVGPSISRLVPVFMAMKKTGIRTLVTGTTRRLSLPCPLALLSIRLVVKVLRTVLRRTMPVRKVTKKVKARVGTIRPL